MTTTTMGLYHELLRGSDDDTTRNNGVEDTMLSQIEERKRWAEDRQVFAKKIDQSQTRKKREERTTEVIPEFVTPLSFPSSFR